MTTKETYLELLKGAIQGKHGCKAFHVESVPVVAQMNGKTVWDGAVEVFELRNNSQSRWCYAWIERPNETQQRFVIILQKGLIVTPQHAVHGWLASKPVTVSPVVEMKAPGRQLLHFPDDGWASNWKDDAEMRPSNESN